jgi:hypothetical protein
MVASALAIGATPAAATVKSQAASWTPQIVSRNALVRSLVKCGHVMYVGGHFTRVSMGGQSYYRRNLFSFNLHTHRMTRWNPKVRGTVNSIALSPTCRIAFLGGDFNRVHGVRAQNLVAVRTRSNHVERRFRHHANGVVNTVSIIQHGRRLIVGGAFRGINGSQRSYLASLTTGTGRVTRYLRFDVAGRVGGKRTQTYVYNAQVSPSGDALLIEGTFTRIAHRIRHQLAEITLGARRARLNRWHNRKLNTTTCSRSFYGRDAAFSPDERTIYMTSTAGTGTSPFCGGAVTAFTNRPRGNTTPARWKWSNYTGQDSLYAVAASAGNVYIGGHERYANNARSASGTCATADCVSRVGIGDISPRTGKATAWNPGRSRGIGVHELLITRGGLWVASDTYFGSVKCAGLYHPGFCFFPGRA